MAVRYVQDVRVDFCSYLTLLIYIHVTMQYLYLLSIQSVRSLKGYSPKVTSWQSFCT